MSSEKERLQILEMVENGQISAEDGVRLLKALGGAGDPGGTSASPGPPDEPSTPVRGQAESSDVEAPTSAPVESAPETLSPMSEEAAYAQVVTDEDDSAHFGEDQDSATMEEILPSGLPPEARRWRSWWMIPLWIGVAITLSGGFLMYSAFENSGAGLGFFCAGVPFLIGLALMALAWQSRIAPWLHLRVQQKPGEWPQRIAFSFPIPIRPTVWLLRTFGGNVRELDDVALDEMLLAVGHTTSAENPIYIQADEGDEGEKVEIYIG